MTVNGTVIGAKGAIRLDADDVRVAIGTTGNLYSNGNVLHLTGDRPVVINDGQMTGDYGVFVYDDGDAGAGTARITNTGSIITQGSTIASFAPMILVNSGIIRCVDPTGSAVSLFIGSDRIINTGIIVGDVFFSSGNDLYDGRKGTVIGTIFGGAGNDRFIPGRGWEAIDDQNGTDRTASRSTGRRTAVTCWRIFRRLTTTSTLVAPASDSISPWD